MTRPSLLRPATGGRHAHRRRARRGARSAETVGRSAEAVVHSAEPVLRSCDPAVQRVRDAGGPIDRACYTCECGYWFSAAVSTTVACPHCGVDQAW